MLQTGFNFEMAESFDTWLKKQKGQQGDCPCCGRFAKVYKRRFNATLAKQLIKFCKAGGDYTYIHTQSIVFGSGTGDFAKLQHWDLIFPDKYGQEGDSNSSGRWKITTKGMRFLYDDIEVPQYIYLYLGKKVGESKETVTLKKCLSDKGFNYNELMEA